MFGLADPPLFFQKEGVPIFECVFSASLEVVDYLRPLLVAVVVFDESQKLDVFGGQPGTLFEPWIQETVPVLPALLGTSEHLSGR